jgi:lipid-A-disaccharide synthase-like uncharacterized protein
MASPAEPAVDGSKIVHNLVNLSAPFGVVGFLAEHFFLSRYFIKFLQARNVVIRRIAACPTEEWRHYLS